MSVLHIRHRNRLRRKGRLLLLALMLAGGTASAQVLIEGNVYGGGNLGIVTENTSVTVNDGTIGKKLTLPERMNDENGQVSHVDNGNVYGGGNGYKIDGYRVINKDDGYDVWLITVPNINKDYGLVRGNTNVTIRGNAVVRRAVYGGGNVATVGVANIPQATGIATYSSGGKTVVTIEGNALIGPTKDDLTKDDAGNALPQADIDRNFKYLGANEGFVFGSSRGISGGALKHLSFADTTIVTITDHAQVAGHVFGGGENGHVQKGTNVIINGDAIIGGVPLHGDSTGVAAGTQMAYPISGGAYDGITLYLDKEDGELNEDEYGVGQRVFRGNVFGGGKGTDFISWWKEQHGFNKYCYTAGRVYGNSHITIGGNAQIYNRVYGGGTIASVGTFQYSATGNTNAVTGILSGGHSYVTVNGGTIGSPGSDGKNSGEVFGGGRGFPGRPRKGTESFMTLHQLPDEAYVGHTHVLVSGGTIMNSVYGGAANGHVQGDANVRITDGTIGSATMHEWHGNVYGGGGGTAHYKEAGKDPHLSITAGAVFGNSNVSIEGGTVYHNVYGGGAIASVGTYAPDDMAQPYTKNGLATVTITGGTIGTDGFENGMVYGSGRGLIAPPGHFLDSLTYVAYSTVNIGTGTVDPGTGTASSLFGTAKINGSVYGGGENGHVFLKTQVNIFKGTIGCTAAEYTAMSSDDKLKKFPYRGNVYGAGCGTDQYDSDGDGIADTYNPGAGLVQGNAEVNIYGGSISHNVYGGGAMASVGFLNHGATVSHLINTSLAPGYDNYNTADEAALSWPYELHYVDLSDPNQAASPSNVFNGKTKINIRGGKIGTSDAFAVSGDVFGSARGEAGPLFVLDTLAIVRETEVYINYDAATMGDNPHAADNIIVGTVYGSGENGSVYEDTKVTIDNAYIGGSVFGGGKGSGTYKALLWDPSNPGNSMTDSTVVRSITAGKVYGNTEVQINDGTILHNVFGGGHAASVGKGNYIGYGEKTTTTSGPDDPYENSGFTTVKIYGGTIGSNGYLDTTNIYNGYVYGSSKGLAYEDITLSPRYNYTRDFFLGYANKSTVVIGNPATDPASDPGPRIWGSVFGGGENGHVRWHTDVTVNKGEIGKGYSAYDPTAGTPDLTADSTVYPGNVYGAGRGIDPIDPSASPLEYCKFAGSVTLNTNVTVNGGTIHRNVYGGGSMAAVGPPTIPGATYNAGQSTCTVNIKGGTIGEVVNPSAGTYFNYGGDIFGASRGIIHSQVDLSKFCTVYYTEVNLDTLKNGAVVVDYAKVPGNVYGGGELGRVKKNTAVNVKAGFVGTIGYTHKYGTDPLAKMDSVYHKTGGSVFGGGRGDITDPVTNREAALVTDTTHVTISGGHVQRSVYGGGEVASVGLREQYNYEYNAVQFTDYRPKQSVAHADSTGVAIVTIMGGQVGPAPKVDGTHNVEIGLNGVDGYVFGGGKGIGDDNINALDPAHPYSGKDYYAIADVNNTYVTVDMPMPNLPLTAADTVNRIWGSTFGGAEDGHVLGSARTYYKNGVMGTTGTTTYDGNIFGGGRNYSKKNYNAGRVRVNDSVDMCGGQIYGSIFGGGRLALTGIDLYGNMIPDNANEKYGNTFVRVSGGIVGNDTRIEEWIASSMGDVYGAGKGDTIGVAGHPKASALLVSLVKNAEVLITDTVIGGVRKSPRILGSVFGGGEVANVGHFTWNIGTYSGVPNIGDIDQLAGTGKTKVTVRGGVIGADKAQMRVEMAAGTGNYNLKYNDDRGHVFGGGEGWCDDPTKYAVINPSSSTPGVHNNKRLIDLMATVGETQVTISDTAFVKGSVYGGSMNGHVLRDAKVTVKGGQIGAGYDPTGTGTEQDKYDDDDFINPITYFGTDHPTATDVAAGDALLGCYRWDYSANNQRPFDPIALKADHVANKPTNGETWFGHVFGGGSGYYPYIIRNQANTADSCIWNPDAGKVFGHTEVEITGGHILSNVYGGCQTSDVGNYAIADASYHASHPEVPVDQLYNNSDIDQSGKAIVTMSGGTVGVPKTSTSIRDFPYISNVYGGGQGDFRDELKALGNVDSTRVTISNDAIVYGMVFGGSQNGHVVDSTKVLVKGGVVGITGLSGYDGLVFGGGQGTVRPNPGYLGDTLYAHAGRVGGNARVVMTGGKALGNLYGGGMVAHTGVGVNGKFDDYTTGTTYASEHHGMAKVELSGGSVGNYFNHGRNLLTSEYASGNVYGAGRGKLDEYDQDDLARLANSAVKISGSPEIYGSVFGGGQMANSGFWLGYAGWYATNTASTRVTITGSPTIGTALEFKDQVGIASYAHNPGDWTYYDTIRFVKYGETTNDTTYLRMLTHTRTGNVFGGGQGEVKILPAGSTKRVAGLEQGHCSTTNVNISGTPTIRGSVFGGSEQGVIWGETEVHITGGTIGTTGITPDSLKYDQAANPQWTSMATNATYSYGSVFGGSYGKDYYSSFSSLNISSPRPAMIDSVNALAGRVYGKTLVDIDGGTIRGNVFGGGNMASVGYWEKVSGDLVPAVYPGITGAYAGKVLGNATVTVSGGEIGPLDNTGLNAYVFGGGKGFSNDPEKYRKEYANVDSTFVTVSGGKIWGSVFGGGSDCHVLGSTSVTVTTGADIGDKGITTWDGNIFGGGRNFMNTNHTNGRVRGNTLITMDGGAIQGSIFGGGRNALTGIDVNGGVDAFLTGQVYDSVNHGLVTINVSGVYDAALYSSTGGYSTSIGNRNGNELLNDSDESVGDIFGSGKGDTKAYNDVLAGRVAKTKINVSGSPRIYGSVFGGGEMAGIGYWSDAAGHPFYQGTGMSEVTIGREGKSDNPVIGTDTEYTTAYASTNPDWTVYDTDGTLIHTCTGNVFGGSQGDVDPTKPKWVSMARSRAAKVVINGGTIKSSVYGGAEQGSVLKDTYVKINGGTIGTVVNEGEANEYLFGSVFGGGYGSHRNDYNTNTASNDSTAALGQDLSRPNHLAGRVYGNVRVDVLNGTIRGDVYGGANYAYIGGYGESPSGNVQLNIGKKDEAGQPIVGNATFLGSVFGANNHSGTPFGNVNVDVYHTAHTAANTAPPTPDGGWVADSLLANAQGTHTYAPTPQQYAIKEVFGGGNRASYTPNQAPNRTKPRAAKVYVHYCENTIMDLYGGSNAADIGTDSKSANDTVVVDGGRFYRVFGGGNGTQTFANVHGTATTRINAGVIQEVYGGGNHNGIIDNIDLEITHANAGTAPGNCDDFIYDVFGGNNEAEVIGDIVSVINCGDGYQYEFYGGNNTATVYGDITTNVFGGETAYLFGGSKGSSTTAAHIRQFPSYDEITADLAAHPSGADTLNRKYSYNLRKHMRYDPSDESTFRTDLVHTKGNVTLNIFGGIISQAAFGGSDENGTIDGKITVNVFDAQTSCNLDLNNLYGAGRNTDYVPIYTPETGTERISPVVNVIHGTVQGSVYGGGMGASATVEASPVVNIGYADVLADTVNTLFDTIHAYYSTWSAPAVADYTAHVNFNVFGGGNEGQVEGNTSVNINKNNTIIEQFVYGAGCGNDTDPDFAKVTGNSSVRIYDGLIKKVVFGGGNTSIVTGNTLVEMSGGEVGNEYAHTGSIFGGGRGCTNPPGSSDDYSGFGRVMGNTNVSISGNAKIYKNVYGGGQIGSVGSGVLNNNTTGVTHVTISGGTIGPFDKDEMNANVFGGSQGFVGSDVTLYTNYANVDSTSVIVCDSAWVQGSVFGGGENGHVLAGTRVLIEKGSNTENQTPVIGTDALYGDGLVFGGGLGTKGSYTAGRVGGNTKVEMTDGTVKGSIYGGGQLALTGVDAIGDPYLQTGDIVYDSIGDHGLAVVEVSGGTIGIGGTDAAGLIAARELLESDYSIGDIFGSGQGDYDDVLAGRVANAKITVSGDPTIYCSVFGGGELAGVGYWREEGGKQKFYDKSGVTSVTIGGSPTIGTELEFTAGYLADPTDWTVLDTVNNVVKLFHTCSGNVFGGSQGDAAVTTSPSWVSLGRSKDAYVHIQGTPEIMSSVFGGAEQGTVAGNTRVTIEGGTIGKSGLTSRIVASNGAFTGNTSTYSFGNVFGGGYGVDSIQIISQLSDSISVDPSLVANVIAGRVYGNTRLDITGGQVHGNVFGGGNMASVGQWTNVLDGSSNLIDFAPVANTGEATVNVGGKAIIGPMDGTGLNAYVFGGGKGIGNDPDLVNNRNKYCNVNSTNVTVELTYANPDDDNPENGWSSTTDGRIYGSVYGGGSDCHVLGDTYVTINSGIIGTYKNADEGITAYGGNIFGSGRNFLKVNYAAGRVAGNTNIEMNGGYVYGAIFGGGRHAVTGTGLDGMTMRDDVGTTDIHGKTTVKVKGGTVGYKPLVTSFIDRPIGDVYGGGKGSMEGIALSGHPAASPLFIALVKNTEVEISETTSAVPTRILNTVYGGGEVGNVGHYTWTPGSITNIALRENTGKTKVTVKGGRIGMDRMVMSYELVGGTGPDRFNPKTNPTGNVFGGGKGISDDPLKYATNISTSPFGNKNLLDLMATVGYTTVVVENDGSTKPWVKGSVYGGSACGHVLHDTDVTIAGGQIGASDNGSADQSIPYEDGDFADASSVDLDDPANAAFLMNPTYHWDYDPATLRPFDIITIYNGIANGDDPDDYKPTDGKTWFGNVYGGGSGFLPYIKNEGTELAPDYKAHWNRESGKVYGNTRVEITGGHILSSVYGGCETADVGLYEYDNTIHGDVHNTSLTGYAENGTAKVIMKGGTVGVPRTTTDIQNHPIPGYVYGSGKGDPRLYFNTWTNVYKVMDTISGGKIYGCVFGSGEDGHVLGDVALEVSEADGTTIIGSTGVSKADGNIFGGGRGTTSEALTAGSVGGNVNVSVLGGTMLGSVYGGGNLASVGIYLVDKFLPGTTTPNDSYYGKFQPGNDHGHITVEISGGTIGNSTETPTHTDPHTIGGNVYGGSRGKFIAYSGSGDMPIWPSLARAKETKVTVKGTATVKNSVYGGGEIGTVRDDTEVNIEENCTIGDNYAGQYCGHVFGGGKGFEDVNDCLSTDNDSTLAAGYLAGHVYGNTYVNIKGGHVWENVFGGGQVASTGWVDGSTLKNGVATVKMTGGIVGPLDYTGLNAYIFGGPKGGSNDQMKPYVNLNSTEVEVNYTTSASNRVWGSLFGGGSDGHVIGDAKVTLKSGTVGTDGTTGYDGNIFGGGRNYRETSLSAGRVGGNITVDMQGGTLQGSIFGGGRQGLTGVDGNGDAYTTSTDSHGNITVTVSGGTVGNQAQMGNSFYSIGDVFGGGKGQPNSSTTGYDHNRLGEVRSTSVTIGGTATVNGSVYGGSENGRVLNDATVNIEENATIGYNPNEYRGNVFGGGRGADPDQNADNLGNYWPNFGRVNGLARVNINGGAVKRFVFGGGDMGIVAGERIVNVNGGIIGTAGNENTGDVYGGSNAVPDENSATTPPTLYTGHGNLKTVNVRGGTILGDVYGSSHSSNEGTGASNWSSFVNITGGTIGDPADAKSTGHVYGAGYEGEVNGKVSVNIGLSAVDPTINTLVAGNTSYKDGLGGSEPTPAKIKIKGNVFDGSNYFGTGLTAWNTYDIEGSSATYLDGTGYNTADDNESSATPYMNIAGGLYGSGTHCESGKTGRAIHVRNYGARQRIGGDNTEMTSATRTLTTIQRGGVVLFDNSNIILSGAEDISHQYENYGERKFGLLEVDEGFYMANGSGLVLGTAGVPILMDSIKEVRSVYLKTAGTSYAYPNPTTSDWELVGIKDNTSTPGLYRTVTGGSSALDLDDENVILFTGSSKLMVRYNVPNANPAVRTTNYGALYGFFRMRADDYLIDDMESFARARVKVTDKVNPVAGHSAPENTADGGFLSYDNTLNDFTKQQTVMGYTYTTDGDDGGTYQVGETYYNRTKQYPYFNLSKVSKMGGRLGAEDYRVWALPATLGHKWYVDGRGIGNGGWGKDATHEHGWGDYPDKPKKTITGTASGTDIKGGICVDDTENGTGYKFNPANDIIFVVGPIDALSEGDNLNLSAIYPLRLYRYPGGHPMSNDKTDAGGGTAPTDEAAWGGFGSTYPDETKGPGVNTGAMIHANKTATDFVLNNVVVDGLFSDYDGEVAQLNIPSSYSTERKNVNQPLVITAPNAKLTLKGSHTENAGETVTDGTILTRGYNNTDGSVWYTDADYNPSPAVNHGGGLFVDGSATVKVEGLVNIMDNQQRNGGTVADPVLQNSNVYLPTFDKSLTISDALNANTRIGVTSPIRKADWDNYNYIDNTFSPVAVATRSGYEADDAEAAWTNNNFDDDLDWFFVNGNTGGNERHAYYDGNATSPNPVNANLNDKTLFFGWTWANAQRSEPSGFADGSGNVTIDSREDMAWLISKVNKLNGLASGNPLSGKTVTQTIDLDMNEFVWVPVGARSASVTRPFSGSFDGKGHLIENMNIDYIGKGDGRYEYNDYGLFGWVVNGTLDRSFVVSGLIRPEGKANIGGLVGYLQANAGTAKVKNSEAAVQIKVPSHSDTEGVYVGGLVGLTNGATIHSSMAMPDIDCADDYGYVGGLLGGNTTASANLLNSFANAKFTLSDGAKTGGLVGNASNLTLKNCYVHLYDKGNLDAAGTAKSFGQLVAEGGGTTIADCYSYGDDVVNFENQTYALALSTTGMAMSKFGHYSPVYNSDTYGYLCMDNIVSLSDIAKPMYQWLNECVESTSGGLGGSKEYARWSRPTLSGINGDLPVLLLDNYDGSDQIGLGDFRSVATIAGSHALQYGGTVRDGNELSTMLGRTEEVFVYGDVEENLASATVNATKVAIYEDAAILNPGALSTYENNYVGVTFDNSSRGGHDAYGNLLGRDWHMFSTPLANAPLGINYNGQNENNDLYKYDPWDGNDELPHYSFYLAAEHDGYFPSQSTFTNTVDPYVYPYDFRCWYEPDWQWINLKRNGPSHWHYDEIPGTATHNHIDYEPYYGAPANVNEESFVVGKGYMMAIQEDTYLQSHGRLNGGDKPFTITNSLYVDNWTWVPESFNYYGNNLVGNPYHAYLDFGDLTSGFGEDNGFSSYYMYNADKDGYYMYVRGGSFGGEYAPRYIHPHQGFFLQKDYDENHVDTTITFQPSQTVTRAEFETSPFRYMPTYKLINLFAYDQEGHGDVVVIEFERPDYGGGEKIKALRSGNHLIYAHHDTIDYGAFFAKQELRRIPVRFKTFEEENTLYTLKWNLQNGYFPTLYLIDNMTGTIYDMTRNDSYLFSASKEDYLSRFYIVFDYNDIEEFEETNTFAFYNGSAWVVNGKGYVELFDVTGRCLYTNTLNGEQSDLYFGKLAKGVYMLRMSDGFTVRTQKIVIQ